MKVYFALLAREISKVSTEQNLSMVARTLIAPVSSFGFAVCHLLSHLCRQSNGGMEETRFTLRNPQSCDSTNKLTHRWLTFLRTQKVRRAKRQSSPAPTAAVVAFV
jgi:hypothetical protein